MKVQFIFADASKIEPEWKQSVYSALTTLLHCVKGN